MGFCHFVHFFADEDAAREWTAKHEQTFILSIGDGFEIGRLANQAKFGEALRNTELGASTRLGRCGASERTRPEAETIVGPEGREGAHIGDGDGLVTGLELGRTVRFSFYTAECPYDPGFLEESVLEFADVSDHVSRINPGGVIETADGASIQFDVKGFGLRLERALPLWSLTGGASAS